MSKFARYVSGLIFVLVALNGASCARSTTNTNQNATVNRPINTSVNQATDLNVTGRVFVKGYGTPSESYGLIVADGREISFGAYDSMREQFRATIGDTLSVTFTSICRTGKENCCRTLFEYCGTVASWKSVANPSP